MKNFYKNLEKKLLKFCPDINKKKILDGNSLQSASLILLFEGKNGISFFLTKRSKNLKSHPGQISLPGGKAELFDKNFGETARRETEEEIGIPESKMKHLGYLPSVYTKTNYVIFPSVAILKLNYADIMSNLKICEQEVEKVWIEPIYKFIDLKSYDKVTNQDKIYWKIESNKKIVWGATAMILNNLALIIKNSFYSN